MSDYIPADLRRRVRAHFSQCCAYCRSSEALTVVTFEVEHILPLSLGGPTEFENLGLACPTCNRYKSNRVAGITDELLDELELLLELELELESPELLELELLPKKKT